ncbi:MAG: hypothetical protein SFU25_01910 [Candidatus Caenarcaniphilales bacterium]|nr:hypothetical protein [Candidatus Caenarcaniphilales bacterium]
MFSEKIASEINSLPLQYQSEVLDFIMFLKSKVNETTYTDYLSENPHIKQSIIEGFNTSRDECSKELNW